MNPKNFGKKIYERFISLKGEPRKIAFGIAIGVFVGVTPTIPLHTILLIFIAFLFKQNFSAAYLGSWIILNPLTMPFFYMAEYQLGKFILGNGRCDIVFTDFSMWCIINSGWNIYLPLLLGGFILAPFFAVPSYFITYRLVLALKKDLGEPNAVSNVVLP